MCGIVGFCGKENALPLLLDGLEKLEYRGYDSAGVAILFAENNVLSVNNTANNIFLADNKQNILGQSANVQDIADNQKKRQSAEDLKAKNSNAKYKIVSAKAKGRLDNLKKLVSGGIDGSLGIGHTRWATHGEPSQTNSHPHLSRSGKFAVVHNGIIENYTQIKDFLLQRSFTFSSETDTEVIAHLLEYYYRGDAVEAIIKTAQRLSGSYALAILCSDYCDTMFAMRKESPLVVGIGAKNGMFAASDMTALLCHTRDFIFPESGEIAIIKTDTVQVVNFNREVINKEVIHADWQEDAAKKNGFEHFMLKEIYEQPRAVADTLSEVNRRLHTLCGNTSNSALISPAKTNDYIKPIYNSIKNIDIKGEISVLQDVEALSIIACGSAYHAGIAAKYFIERLCRIPVECEMASEFRYKNPIIKRGTVGLAISQSGETADTIAALNEIKKSAKTLSLVNVLGSSVARQSDEVVYTLAGPEIAVATTKGYISQVAALHKIGLYLCRKRLEDGKTCDLDFFDYSVLPKNAYSLTDGFFDKNNDYPQNISSQNNSQLASESLSNSDNTQPTDQFKAVKTVHDYNNYQNQPNDELKNNLKRLEILEQNLSRLSLDIKNLLSQKEIFQQLSSRFSFVSAAFFIGRGIDYAIAMEGALKLKEISYIHAQSYPAGELKHGTISLIEQDSLVVVVSTDRSLIEKTVNNIKEVRSRGAVVLAVTCFDEVIKASNYHAKIDESINSPMLAAVSLQLFAYYVALARGCDIDKPRNLAKSVTVE